MTRLDPTADAWLVLCEPGDPVAAWVHAGLQARRMPTQLVTALELCAARALTHSIAGTSATLDIELADGRLFQMPMIRGVVNRLARVPEAVLALGQVEDRGYAEQEWRAFLCSALHALAVRGVPVLDVPHPYGLAGRWRSPGAWALLATRAGFEVPDWRWGQGSRDPQAFDGAQAAVVTVIGDRVIGRHDAAIDENACLSLARLAGVQLLAITVRPGPRGAASFVRASTMPDLRLTGPAGLDALVSALS